MVRRIRRLLFCAAAGFLYYSGLLSLWGSIRRRVLRRKEICVLGLHRVLSDAERSQAASLSGIVLRDSTFAELLRFLNQRFSVISLDAFLKALGGNAQESKPLCLLTFDDGWRDNFANALPLLSKFQMPAVIFVATGFMGGKRMFWVERLRRAWEKPQVQERLRKALAASVNWGDSATGFADLVEHLKHMPSSQREGILAERLASLANDPDLPGDEMLTWEEAALLQKGGVEIEAHTINHPLLVYEDDLTVARELAGSRQAIEEKLKKRVRAFAYPNGSWNERVRNQVQSAGYECAFTTARGWHHRGKDPFAIRRIMVHEGTLTGLDGNFSPALAALRLTGWI